MTAQPCISATGTQTRHPPLRTSWTRSSLSPSNSWPPHRFGTTAISQPLNALPRSAAPLATKAALVQMPAVTLDTAAKCGNVGLLRFMHAWSKKPNGRPLQYTPIGLVANAMLVGSIDVLDWWIDESSGVYLNWDWDNEQMLDALMGEHGIKILEWWARRGCPFIEHPSFPAVLLAASKAGRVDTLKWLLAHIPAEKMLQYSGKSSRNDAVKAAAENGHVHVLDFWLSQGDACVIPKPDLTGAFSAAIHGNQVGVLQWLDSHPQLVNAVKSMWQQSQSSNRGREYVLADAVKRGLLDWMVKFGLEPYQREYLDACLNACKAGDLDTVKRLKELGFWKGSRLQLVDAAVGSANLALLDWIRLNTDATAPASKKRTGGFGLPILWPICVGSAWHCL
ncbi:hypothetical protein BCR44DRAFT_1251854 [Catenaria anguillulae PL171]|uniref:Ankyrin repeat-containing domain protein n=1 Tax=Catenaria anguillulae PL171 TaxID=765915 RepID=A0A1Y2HYF5_9FUNG|nr:hypothetical protein BCR44DRAFT_1251854 [Catenaria anguillulae PL171]